MNKKRLLKLLELRNKKKEKLVARSGATEDIAELRAINEELTALNEEIAEIREEIEAIEAIEKEEEEENRNVASMKKKPEDGKEEGEEGEERSKDTVGKVAILKTYKMEKNPAGEDGERGISKEEKEKNEERAAYLKEGKPVSISFSDLEKRAITVASTGVLMPRHTSNVLNEAPLQASDLFDYVDVVNLQGGESFEKGFVKNYVAGGYTVDGADASLAEPVFDFVTTGKSLITSYAEVSKGALKLPNANYETEVLKAVETALKMKFNTEIIAGDGATGHLTGILNSPASVGTITLDMSAINSDSVDDIVFSVAGNKAVTGNGFLVLNKKDLAAMNKIRSTDGKKLYQIKLDDNGNTGTISSDEVFSARFIIDDVLPALSASGTAVDTKCMVYGKLKGYHVPIFSEVVIERSDDHKFRSGLVAYRAEVYAGGTPAAYQNFVIVKKVAAI